MFFDKKEVKWMSLNNDIINIDHVRTFSKHDKLISIHYNNGACDIYTFTDNEKRDEAFDKIWNALNGK